ncbi:hypothetical protein CLOM_g1106 [Closterium sp. NIES-68]|nr:hypothetical protein CLOM_g1106 [Closterium sp. NIES-68]GJP73668.1 hypothetical protein CLOP_g4363 [Closterium sp. NIES-67]
MTTTALRHILAASLLALLVVSCAARGGGGGREGGGGRGGGGGGGGHGGGGGEFGGGFFGGGRRKGSRGLGTRVGALYARLNGTETTVAGDVNATGVISLAVFQSGSDYNIRYGASIRLTAPGAPLSIAISTGAAGAADGAAAILEFSATEAAWTNMTWNGTRRDARGRKRTAPVPKYFGFFRPSVRTGYVYGFSGVWYNATQYSNAAGQSYFDVANLLLANPSGYYGIVKTETFADGAARGQFANFTRPTPDAYWQRN